MEITQFYNDSKEMSLRNSIVKIINAKIQHADQKLNRFMSSLKMPNQKPSRPDGFDMEVIESEKNVFEFIENSSLQTTKLLYLRANVSEYNSHQVLKILSNFQLESIALHELKEMLM